MEDLEPAGWECPRLKARLDLGAVADQEDVEPWVCGHRLHRTGNDRSRCVITPHRVQCDTHGSFLLFHRYDFSVLIVAAVRTDPMRQHRLIASAAVLNLERFNVVVAPPFALAGVGGPSLWDCHGVWSCLSQVRGKVRYPRSAALQGQGTLTVVQYIRHGAIR